MKQKVLLALIAILIVGGSLYYSRNKNKTSAIVASQTPITTSVPNATNSKANASSDTKQSVSTSTSTTVENKIIITAKDETWKKYSYDTFSISFPYTKPQLIDQSTPSQEYRTYFAVQKDGTTYFIDELNVPKELIGDTHRQTLMNAASIVINQAKQSAEVNIDYAIDLSSELGYPAIQFNLAISEGPRELYGRYILLGNKMYQMRVVTTVKSEKNAEYTKFFESFTPKN